MMLDHSPYSLRDPAVALAAAGWQLFPVSTRGGRKAPLIASPHRGEPGHGCHGECGKLGHGFYDATSDVATIAAWWTRHPTALIGCRVPSHMLVLDVDPRGGGDDTLARLEAEHGPLPETLTCYSGRGDGGRHLYLTRPAALRGQLTGTKLSPGIDLIHHGLRYTIMPPSLHPKTGQPYYWADPSVPPADPSAWLTTLLTPAPPTPRRRSAVAMPRRRWSVAGLVEFVENHDTAEGTGRHDAVLWALSRAWEQGATDGEMDDVCWAAEGIGKSLDEIDDLRAWVEGNVEWGAL